MAAARQNPPTLAEYRSRAQSVLRFSRKPERSTSTNLLPLVSVVTVVRNGRRFLEQAIRSVAAQTYANIEYIIVDGASNDGTLELIQDNEQYINHWISEPDGGIYDGFNKGIALSSGRYIKLLNADDCLAPNSVTRAVAAFASRERVCVAGAATLVSMSNERLGEIPATKGGFCFPIMVHSSWYVPLSVYEELGLYRTDLRIASDYDYCLRLQSAGIAFIHLSSPPLVHFRQGGASDSWRSVPEVFSVTRSHRGFALAACATAEVSLLRGRGQALRWLLGAERFAALRRKFR